MVPQRVPVPAKPLVGLIAAAFASVSCLILLYAWWASGFVDWGGLTGALGTVLLGLAIASGSQRPSLYYGLLASSAVLTALTWAFLTRTAWWRSL
jgi:hypothetical protein